VHHTGEREAGGSRNDDADESPRHDFQPPNLIVVPGPTNLTSWPYGCKLRDFLGFLVPQAVLEKDAQHPA
jgi:hypothetical protein